MKDSEILGHILGVAAIVAALPGLKKLPADRIGALIDNLAKAYPAAGVKGEVAARQMASAILAARPPPRRPRRT